MRFAAFLGFLFLTVFHPVSAQKPNGLVVVLSDVGSSDFYLGAIKGSIYAAFPEARVDVISSEVPRGNIREGSYLLARAAASFPPGTVFCVAVGAVGSSKAIAVESEDGKFYVAPDNGVLTLVLRQSKARSAYQIVKSAFLRGGNAGSPAFPGRDVYAPAAAALAKGTPMDFLGPPAGAFVAHDITDPKVAQGELIGEVEHIDAQGNIMTNIPKDWVEKFGLISGKTVFLTVGLESVEAPFMKAYSDVRQANWLVLVNDFGMLEIARYEANANAILQARDGSIVKIRR